MVELSLWYSYHDPSSQEWTNVLWSSVNSYWELTLGSILELMNLKVLRSSPSLFQNSCHIRCFLYFPWVHLGIGRIQCLFSFMRPAEALVNGDMLKRAYSYSGIWIFCELLQWEPQKRGRFTFQECWQGSGLSTGSCFSYTWQRRFFLFFFNASLIFLSAT